MGMPAAGGWGRVAAGVGHAALVIGLGLLGAAAAWAQGPTFAISGQVRDLNGTGVAGVPVTLAGAQTGATVTDGDGRFAFAGLPAGGTYTVTPTGTAWSVAPVDQTVAGLTGDRVDLTFVATRGAFTRYFAEGATSAFFDTQVALLNTTGAPTTATVRFQQPAPIPEVTTTVALGGHQRVTLDPKTLGLPHAEFATVIAADQPILADRTMTWDATGYGSHAETSVAQPRTSWFLAEGATHSGFELFYLVQNPGDTAAVLEVRYLLPAPTPPLVKPYTVAPHSRFNIWVNREDAALAAAEISAMLTVTNAVPVIVERAMYRPVNGQVFGAGHDSAGVAAPAPQWVFAEGATGPMFDLFFLIANPHAQAAQVDARYLKPDGTVVTRTYAVAPTSRFTIWVDQEGAALADTAVATTFTVTNAVPVVVERAMWWGDATGWYEGHNAAGATTTGQTWGLAEGEVGGPQGRETYLLIGNPADRAGTARVTLTFEDGAQAVQEVALPPTSRTNVAVAAAFPEAADRRFGAVVESVGPAPVPLIVERAMYHDAGGVPWAAGTSAMGTILRADGAGPTAATAAAWLPAVSGPIHLPAPVTPVREAAHATTATVGPAGGTVVATAATGTTYTLTIPRGALRTPTSITLTPVTALSGLAAPLDLVAAVQGAPDGLAFALPATLTITWPQPPTGVLLGLVLPDAGTTLQVTPIAYASATSLTVPVAHFSTIAIPSASAALLALLPAGTPHTQAGALGAAALTSGQPADVQALLDHLVAWFDTRIEPEMLTAADVVAADAVRLAWLAEFYAWDSWRAITEHAFGTVPLGGTPARGRLTARATDGRQAAVPVLGHAYAHWNTACQTGAASALPARLALADRAARFAVLAEFYFGWLQDNQADAAAVDQAATPNRDVFGIGGAQIPASFCLLETIAVAEPAVAPGATGQLRVTAGSVFGAEPPAYGDVMEVAFQPDPASVAGQQTLPTTAAGETFFAVTADGDGQLHYRVCAYYRAPAEGASFVTLLYRFEPHCREAVTGVLVTPAQVTLSPGASQHFTVVVEGAANQAVTWTVDGGGTLTSGGLFTSNGTLGTFYVRATSVEDPTAVGVAQITVRTPPPPPPAYPCADAACTYTGTWTRCEWSWTGRWICQDYTSVWSSPEVRVRYTGQNDPVRITVAFTCNGGATTTGLNGTVDASGAFTASLGGGVAYCVLGTATGTLTEHTLSFELPYWARPTEGYWSFTGSR